MDGLDKITLALMVLLVVVALLFPLSGSRGDGRKDGDGAPAKDRKRHR
ncbi:MULTISPECIES: hypothetical protein [unclassified Herbaspirillum]|nr:MULTISPECIES: hypothetical protein [unclassified Herbaspirillum]MBB5392389.1 hypothetical protein [Herbaspirillum sp. SJZ102]